MNKYKSLQEPNYSDYSLWDHLLFALVVIERSGQYIKEIIPEFNDNRLIKIPNEPQKARNMLTL